MSLSDLEVATRAAALAAGLAGSRSRERLTVEFKGSTYGSPVTAADRDAEQAVREFLARERPMDGIVGEEFADTPGTRQWLVDPIDGTLNYLRGDPYWCSAIALVEEGHAVVSAVHSGDSTWSAQLGRGATYNGQSLRLDTSRHLAQAMLATFVQGGDLACATHREILGTAATVRVLGSGTLDLVRLASGHLDAWVQRATLPWDWYPGALVVTEAGGRAEQVTTDCGRWALAGSVELVGELLELISRDRPCC